MSLYPLKFKPRFVEKIWGGRKLETVLGKPLPAGKLIGESWELYDFPPGVVDKSDQWVSSEIANGPLAGRTLHSLIEEFGRDVHGDVPLLHPRGGGTTLKFSIESNYATARDVEQQILAEVAKLGVDPNTQFAAKLALEELVIETIKHANRLDPRKKVRLRAIISPASVDLTIEDDAGESRRRTIPLAGATGESTGQFPILIKFLDAREDLSVQVHPDQDYANTHPGAHLKTEAWYVVESDADSRILKGLRPGVTRERMRDAVRDGSVESLITAIAAKPGQCHFLPSGTVHALGAGILVAEVQTPSDTTFRLFDFNRIDASTGKPRQLHVEEALACIDFSGAPEPRQERKHVAGFFTTVTQLVSCPYFKIEKVRMSEGVEEPVPYDEPVVWMFLEGHAEVRVDGVKEPTTMNRGETILLPAGMKNPVIKTLNDCQWLEVTFPQRA